MSELRLVVSNKSSSDSGIPRSLAARKSLPCHFQGTEPRSFHMRRAGTLTPSSPANESMVVQVDFMRGEFNKSFRKSRTICSVTGKPGRGRFRPMSVKFENATTYKRGILTRTKQARLVAGFEQLDIAQALSISRERVSQYENRSPLPHYLIGPFCELTGCDPAWLITGKSQRKSNPLSRIGGAE